MTNLTTKLMIAAAAFVAVAGVASAESMEAKIPFAFRASGKVLAPGTYRVRVDRGTSGVPVIFIGSREPGQQALAVPFASGSAKKDWTSAGTALLSFECGVGRCALNQVWMGDGGSPVYKLHVPSLGKDEPRHVTEIVMHSVKAD